MFDPNLGGSNNANVGVSKYRGIPKWIGLQWKTLLKWMIWGYHYFWKHPFGGDQTMQICMIILKDSMLAHWIRVGKIKGVGFQK